MPDSIQCPNCGTRYSVSAELAHEAGELQEMRKLLSDSAHNGNGRAFEVGQ